MTADVGPNTVYTRTENVLPDCELSVNSVNNLFTFIKWWMIPRDDSLASTKSIANIQKWFVECRLTDCQYFSSCTEGNQCTYLTPLPTPLDKSRCPTRGLRRGRRIPVTTIYREFHSQPSGAVSVLYLVLSDPTPSFYYDLVTETPDLRYLSGYRWLTSAS